MKSDYDVAPVFLKSIALHDNLTPVKRQRLKLYDVAPATYGT